MAGDQGQMPALCQVKLRYLQGVLPEMGDLSGDGVYRLDRDPDRRLSGAPEALRLDPGFLDPASSDFPPGPRALT